MSPSDTVASLAFGALALAVLVAPEHLQTMAMAAVLVGTLQLMHRRLASRAQEGAGGAIPLGDGAVIAVNGDGPEAFLLAARALDSGERGLVCTSACPNPAMRFVLGAEGGALHGAARRATLELDGETLVVFHQGGASLLEELRSGEANETLRALAAFGQPRVAIEEGRMEVRLEGSAEAEARPLLVALARTIYRLAGDAAAADTAEAGPYR